MFVIWFVSNYKLRFNLIELMCIKFIILGFGEVCIEVNKYWNCLVFDVMILLILIVELYIVFNR